MLGLDVFVDWEWRFVFNLVLGFLLGVLLVAC